MTAVAASAALFELHDMNTERAIITTVSPTPRLCILTLCVGRHLLHIQAVAYDLLIAFSLIFPRTHGFRSTTVPAVIK